MPRYTCKDMLHRLIVDKVFLDGKIVEQVSECDTDEGWIKRYTGRIAGDELETETMIGKVEVHIR